MLLAILAIYVPGRHAPTSPRRCIRHFRPRTADLAVARLLRLLRGQGADVAGAYLAARRACRGADRGLGHPGGRAAEDGRLRLHPLLAADAAAGLGDVARRSSSRCRVVAIIYTSLVALAQEDMKKLIAYSSVAHMGIVTIGIFTVTVRGAPGRDDPDAEPRHRLGGAVPLSSASSMTASTPARSRATAASPTTCRNTPPSSWSSCWPRSGCPAPAGFVGEFLSLIGTFQVNTWVAFLATTGMILGAAYMLYLYRRVDLRRHHPRRCPRDARSLPARGGDVRADDRRRAVDGGLSHLVPAADAARASTSWSHASMPSGARRR